MIIDTTIYTTKEKRHMPWENVLQANGSAVKAVSAIHPLTVYVPV